MTLKEMREKQAALVAQARELLDKANKDEARAAEYEGEHDKAMAEYDALEAKCERAQKQADIEARFEARNKDRRPKGDDLRGNEDPQGDDDAPDYRSVFIKLITEARGVVGDLSSEERAILRAGSIDVSKGRNVRAQVAGGAAAGGYTVPTELAAEIIRAMKAFGPMYDEDICTTWNSTSGNAVKLPTIDDTSKSAGAHTEAAALTDDGSEDAVFGQRSLDAYVFDTEFVRWSFELEDDSIINIEQLLNSLLGERLGRVANLQLTVGTGTNAPNGIVTASTLGKTAGSATAVTFDEIIDLEHSVDPAYRSSPKCRFMLNDNTLKAVRKLKDGQGNYLWQQGNVQGGIPNLINNRPYSINQAMADIATGQKTMLFGDFGKYFVRKVGGPVIGVLRERFWPDLGIAGLIRIDGELGDTRAIKHLIQA